MDVVSLDDNWWLIFTIKEIIDSNIGELVKLIIVAVKMNIGKVPSFTGLYRIQNDVNYRRVIDRVSVL